MIQSTILFVTLAFFNQQPLSQEQLLIRALALYDRLAGPYTQVGLRVDQGWQQLREKLFIVATPSARIALNRDGTLRSYECGLQELDLEEETPRLTTTDARRLAIEQFRELWPSFSEVLATRGSSGRTPGGPTYTFNFTLREGPWRFGDQYGAEVTVNALTGQVVGADSPRLPLRPSWVPPSISAAQAETTMLDFLQGHARGRIAVMEPVAHQVWVPRYDFLTPSLTSMPSAWRNYERENRGVLIYTGRWSDIDRTPFSDGSLPIWDVFVDPQTGRVIGAYTSANASVFGGGSPVRKPVASQWDLGVGPLTVSYRGRTADVAAGDVADLGFKKPPKDAEPIRLTRGRLVSLATYSRSTGLLYLPSLGGFRAGRPNPALLHAVAALASPHQSARLPKVKKNSVQKG